MNLKNKILYGLGVAGMITSLSPFCKSAKAENLDSIIKSNSQNKTEITIPFRNPLTDFEANTNFFYSTNEITGKGIEKLGEKTGLNDNVAGRSFLSVLNLYNAYLNGIYSHESAHIREGIKGGEFKFEFKFPAEKTKKNCLYTPTNNQLIESSVAGLNQNEGNAKEVMKNIYLKNENMPLSDASYFLTNKLYDLVYALLWTDGKNSWEGKTPSEISPDIDRYLCALEKKGLKLTQEEIAASIITADVLSIQNWDSARAIMNYIKTGETTKPTIWNIKGTEITPPSFSHYLTLDGRFINANTIINPNKKNPLELSLGFNLENGKDLRFGLQYHNLKIPNTNISISPYGALGEGGNCLLGANIEIPISNNARINLKFQNSNKDIIESGVKGNKGRYATGYLSFSF